MIRCRFCMTPEEGLTAEKDVCKNCLPLLDKDGSMSMENWEKGRRGFGERMIKSVFGKDVVFAKRRKKE